MGTVRSKRTVKLEIAGIFLAKARGSNAAQPVTSPPVDIPTEGIVPALYGARQRQGLAGRSGIFRPISGFDDA